MWICVVFAITDFLDYGADEILWVKKHTVCNENTLRNSSLQGLIDYLRIRVGLNLTGGILEIMVRRNLGKMIRKDIHASVRPLPYW